MKPQSNVISVITKSRAALVVFSGVALAMGLTAVRAQADQWDKLTKITIDQPMQVTNTYLEPGRYVFKLADSSSDRHIVQIFNGSQTHLITTVLAVPDYRVQVTGKPQLTMWETPAGYAHALRAWYYPGDNFGQEFPYPKHLRQLEVAEVQTAPPPAAFAPAHEEPAPSPQAEAQPAEPEPEIAQNTPPPPPPAAEDEPAPAPAPAPAASTPEVLPKTASPYPLIGFIGVLLLGLGGLLRQTRSA